MAVLLAVLFVDLDAEDPEGELLSSMLAVVVPRLLIGTSGTGSVPDPAGDPEKECVGESF